MSAEPAREDAEIAEVILRGVRVRYVDEGAGDAPPAVLLHGLGRSHGQWRSLARTLRERRRVISFDVPGFGGSESPAPSRFNYTLEGIADCALDLVAALGLGRIVMVGHSMGAGAAIVAASERPEFVERLVLVSPPCYRVSPPPAQRLLSMPIISGTLLRRALGNRALAPHGNLDAAVVGDATFTLLRHLVSGDTARALSARLPRVRCPTMIVWGRDDRVRPSSLGPRLARELGGARLEVLECGHSPEAEQREAFDALVSGYLDRRPELAGEARPAEALSKRSVAAPWQPGRDDSDRR